MNVFPNASELQRNWKLVQGNHLDLPDTVRFLDTLSNLDETLQSYGIELHGASFFHPEKDIFVARAPGRLDVMGGIADYSGSLVLQMPIREACHVAVQRTSTSASSPVLRVVTAGLDPADRSPLFQMDLDRFTESATGGPITYEEAAVLFEKDESTRWAGYVAGTLLALMRQAGASFLDDITVFVSSDVPEGKGVSSSAAIEVASMSAFCAAHDIALDPRQLAILCQTVENKIVGAPCGVMDQMASTLGRMNQLLALLCQPAEVIGHVSVPAHVALWGIDSGVRHSVGGSDYGTVRAAAFIGRKLLGYDNHLCNLPPHEFESCFLNGLPESMEGSSFLEQYGSHGDDATAVIPGRLYPVKASTCHPVYENFRVRCFVEALAGVQSEAQLATLGELMLQSHVSYSRCGLGSDATDLLVAAAKEMGAPIYGAKITGGGSGGTVCLLSQAGDNSMAAMDKLKDKYESETGRKPYVFQGSSPGAHQFGHLIIRLN